MNVKTDSVRRALLKGISLAPLSTLAPGLSVAATGSGLKKRMVLVILRGAMDGLAAVQPYGDDLLKGLRPSLLSNDDTLFKLDSYFGLHPALVNLAGMYSDNELTVYHAVAGPYRNRSHFDAQNILETGTDTPDQGMSGWLNRTVPYLINDLQSPVMSIGQTTPKILDGAYEISSWAPGVLPTPSDSTINRMQQLYAADNFLAERFNQGLMAMDLAGGISTENRTRQNFSSLAQAAGKFLSVDGGPVIAVLELNGWDTHANQGTSQGQLSNKLSELDTGLAVLKNSLGSHWQDTVILAVTEFGRTAAENGTGGTDHGTASAAFMLGGAVNGGRIVTDWPGLDIGSLYEGRDLHPTLDMRSLFATVLETHLNIDHSVIESDILPGFKDSCLNL